jgi:hypothetical protein
MLLNQILSPRSSDVSRKRLYKLCGSLPIKVQCQHHSVAAATGTHQRFTIPKPTWSIQSLQLHESHAPADMKELEILAKRSVLDLRQFDDETKQQLRQNLGNMLHMMKQVQRFQSTKTVEERQDEDDDQNNPIMLYDVPRGVTEAPFRIDANITTTTSSEVIASPADDREEHQISQSVRESYLAPNMTRVGGHLYYEIVTSIQRTANGNDNNNSGNQ